MSISKIEWTESTWNPVTGCTKISDGCKNCYAERMSARLKAMGQQNYKNGFNLTLQPHMLDTPLKWRKPQMIFVNSMSDLFHEDVPDDYIYKAFDTMNEASWHTFQVLTKRADRLARINTNLNWPPNVWMGVSVENESTVPRIEKLQLTSAKVKFLSMEPLIGSVGRINLKDIDWAIVGGESGPGSRPMLEEWVLEIKEQCEAVETDFFFKQWGGVNKKKTGRILLGQTWDAMPKVVVN